MTGVQEERLSYFYVLYLEEKNMGQKAGGGRNVGEEDRVF